MSCQPKTTSNTGKFEVVARKAAEREGLLALGAGLPASETLPACAQDAGGTGRSLYRRRCLRDIAFGGFTPPSLLSLERESTFHLGTLSKSVCPGLRVGWVVPPPALARMMLKLKRLL